VWIPKRLIVVGALCIGFLTFGSPDTGVTAAPGDAELLVTEYMGLQTRDPSHIGYTWTLGTNPGASYVARTENSQSFGYGTITLCSSIIDPRCSPVPNSTLFAQVVLGACRDAEEIGCIEGLSLIQPDGTEETLVALGEVDSNTSLAELRSAGMPRGGSFPMWRANDGTRYVVTSRLDYSARARQSEWSDPTRSFELAIRRLDQSSQARAPFFRLGTNPSNPAESRVEIEGARGNFIEMDPAVRLVLSFRLPDDFQGWVHGRFTDAVVTQIPTGAPSGSIRYRVEGRPARTNVAGGWFSLASLPTSTQMALFGSSPPSPGGVGVGVAGERRSLTTYALLESLMGSRNLMETVQWSFRSASVGSLGSCASAISGLEGVIATNSAVYDDAIPRWDPTTKTLSIDVASPHLTSDGAQSIGEYSAALPERLVRCLWELDQVPSTAAITVDHDDSLDENIPGPVTEDSGWVNVSMRGFHFSSPTVGLSFLDPDCSGATSTLGTPGRSAGGFTSLVAPVRLMDSRASSKVGTMSGGLTWCELTVAGRAGVPGSASAVALNVTAVDTIANEFGGYVTVYPCGTRPEASNLNFVTGQTTPNAVLAPLSADGKVCFYVYGAAHLLVDVSGSFSSGFEDLIPRRILDSRNNVGTSGGKIGRLDGSGQELELQVTGSSGVPGSASAVALNVTAVDTSASDVGGYVTVYPCGTRPEASNLNFVSGRNVANSVIAPLSADGKVCFYVYGNTHLLADLSGYFTTGFEDLVPQRVLDTRSGVGAAAAKVGELDGTGAAVTLQVTGRGGVPSNATATALNVTAVNTTTPNEGGYVTVYPCGTRPTASNLNFTAGLTVPNLVLAPLSSDGTVCLYVYGKADLLVDVSGYFTD